MPRNPTPISNLAIEYDVCVRDMKNYPLKSNISQSYLFIVNLYRHKLLLLNIELTVKKNAY